jgi:hypothetical protein
MMRWALSIRETVSPLPLVPKGDGVYNERSLFVRTPEEPQRCCGHRVIYCKGRAKVENEALCQTLEMGLDTVELARISIFKGGLIQKFERPEKEQESCDKLMARTAFSNPDYS